MFRLKIALVFVLLVSFLVGTTFLVTKNQLGSTLDADAEISLQRAATLGTHYNRINEYALLEKAKFVARRAELNQAMTAEYDGDAEYERHMLVHRWLERDQIAFSKVKPKEPNNLDRSLLHREPNTQELFAAIDASGYGVATVGPDLLSWFGDNVSKQFPIILDVMNTGEARTDVWLWSYNPTDAKQLYVVAIAPIRSAPNAPILGVVVLGNAITNGVAKGQQQMLTGISNSPRTEALTPQIAYFYGSKIYGSTLNLTQQNELARALLEDDQSQKESKSTAVEIDATPYNAVVNYFPSNSSTENKAGFILLNNTDTIQQPFVKAMTTITFVAAAYLVIGLGLFFFFIFQFTRPITKIENGVNEIITGNKDYEFVAHPGNEYTASLSHALNLLSAYLQGKSLDDDAPEGGWDELMPEAVTSVEDRKGAAPKVQGISMAPKAKEPEESTPTEEV